MHRYSNLTEEDLLAKMRELQQFHENKKLEITNLTKLVDKKIGELVQFEEEYVEVVQALHIKRKEANVVR